MSTARGLIPAIVGIVLVAACAPKPPSLPSGTGTPFPDYLSAYQQATSSCRGLKTLSASMALSGKVGTTKLRGRIDAGFEAPGRARLEGLAPFGKPVFILVADADRATLVLPREDRVLRDAPPDEIVEALAGIRLSPDVLRTVISGCGLGLPPPDDGRAFANGWVSVSAADDVTYLRRRADTWEVAAATRGSLTVTYGDDPAGRPTTVRLRAQSPGGVSADLTLQLSDVDRNTPLDSRVFIPELPEHPVPMTLEELRRAGPLGGG
jgi:hypothetical protein